MGVHDVAVEVATYMASYYDACREGRPLTRATTLNPSLAAAGRQAADVVLEARGRKVTVLGDVEVYAKDIGPGNRGRNISLEAKRERVRPPLVCNTTDTPWKLFERDPGTNNVLIDAPCVVEDQKERGLLWYLPGAGVAAHNDVMVRSLMGLGPTLEKSILKDDRKEQRPSSFLFKDAQECKISPRGTINFSPAWYGQSNPRGPVPSWVSDQADTLSIHSGILCLVHPPQFYGGLHSQATIGRLTECRKALAEWPSVFDAMAIFSNRETLYH
ncbi:hypothetical protein CONPUDRAFT_71612 [Coniophora puteana RWD-64-598 SS2]|uniref:Uncharacterized protein n=1 Tax=Coniophora puteana (strain RWD-64-598) TaxID=741705 RepID=A0A5M3MV09_CONPW|nr:uncharacterized protein CONPUDRAFT_71612 [Coniophora puteana RWD-64-598 SS2]EIW82953.1 hypothetical protein CONPUDRAFT_71612 [Coniophora puteana RWD-64-598 SS2]